MAGLAWVYKNRGPELLEVDLPVAQEYEDFIDREEIIEDVDQDMEIVEVEESEEVVDSEPILPPQPEVSSINLAVPFTSQAPTSNWEQPFQDACEEASVLMVDHYYQNKNFPDKKVVEDILIKMVDWQDDFMNGTYDITIGETSQLAREFFGYKTELVPDLTVAKIEALLREGIPVIVPANGKKLDNPNFRNGGPEYHMLVIKGFAENKFITNDPGTRLGADFIYTYENLMYSIADWNQKESLAVGPKIGLVLYKD